MRRSSVRSGVLLGALVLAAHFEEGAAAERFRPADPDFVVLRVPPRAAQEPLERLDGAGARAQRDPALAAALAQAYLQRAREHREPRYFGRAEALIAPWIATGDAPAALLRVQADILQNRHDFAAALRLLDRAVAAEPHDPNGRLMRATVLMVQGEFARARPDCAALLAAREVAVGTVCLAQVLGGSGGLARARELITTLLAREPALPPAVRAWALTALADFADRGGDPALAERHLRAAVTALPHDEAARTALADVLLARGAAREAFAVVDVERPSLGLLVRRAHAQELLRDPAARATRARIEEILQLGIRRGERVHLREEALLAWHLTADASRALELARANFAQQRETIDVRLLAAAARAQGDAQALRELESWQRATGFEDHFLQAAPAGTES